MLPRGPAGVGRARAGRRRGAGPYTRPVTTLDPPGPLPHEPSFWWRTLSPIGALLGAFVIAALIAVPLSVTPMGEDGLLTVVQFASSLLILGFGLLLLRRLPALDQRRALAPKGGLAASIGLGLAVGVGMVALSIAIIGIGVAIDSGLEEGLEDIALEFEPVLWQTTMLVIALTVLAPLGEELLFRVLLLRALVRRMSFWKAAVLSGVLFAAAHPDGYLLWPRALALVVSGIALAWIYRERGYPAAVAAHATLNGIAAISVATA